MILCPQKYQQVVIDAVKPHPLNPNVGRLSAIAESIDRNGFYGAIVVQRSTRFILAGNHRWLAARSRGDVSVPALMVDVDDATARRILLADNRTADLAVYDDSALLDVLAEIQQEEKSLAGTGYKEKDLESLIAKLTPKEPSAGDVEQANAAANGDEAEAQYKLCVRCRSPKTRMSLSRRLKKTGYKVENG